MKFTAINDLPENVIRRRKYHKVRRFLEEFITQNVKYAKVEYFDGEYAHAASAYSQLNRRIKEDGLPVDVVKNGDEIYLIRRDM